MCRPDRGIVTNKIIFRIKFICACDGLHRGLGHETRASAKAISN
jgi:hypothetical protein